MTDPDVDPKEQRVARSIYESVRREEVRQRDMPGPRTGPEWERLHWYYQCVWRDHARAAIAAIEGAPV